jgi:hypothetical protein
MAGKGGDPVKVAPDAYTVLFQNRKVRILEACLSAGEKTPLHWHPPNVVYPLSSGKLAFTFPGGKKLETELNEGKPKWDKGGSHSTRNVGATEVRALVIELK